MTELLLTKCLELRFALRKQSCFVQLEKSNSLLNESEEVAFQSFLMNNAQAAVEYALEKGSNSKEISLLRKKFSEAKKTLYLNPLVVEYHVHYKKTRDILSYLNKRIYLHFESEAHLCV